MCDEATGHMFKNLLLLLTEAEAKHLAVALRQLLAKEIDHAHVDDQDYKHEITVLVYSPDNLHLFAGSIADMVNSKE
jgi:hypothetical protein